MQLYVPKFELAPFFDSVEINRNVYTGDAGLIWWLNLEISDIFYIFAGLCAHTRLFFRHVGEI